MKFTTYLTDASQLEAFKETREELFAQLYPDGGYPPNTLVIVNRLVQQEYLLEIDAVAHVGEPETAG